MSKVKIATNEFLESQELNRQTKFIFDDGFIQNIILNTSKYGFLSAGGKTIDNTNYLTRKDVSFRLQPGTGQVLKFTEAFDRNYAIDKNGNVLTTKNGVYSYKIPTGDPNAGTTVDTQDLNGIYIPASSQGTAWWIKATYKKTPIEIGICSIDANGTVTGVGTKFTEVLRGQLTNFPSKIQFVNSLNGNTYEYQIASITSDTLMVLAGGSGMFNIETGLMYKVIGTFTPGYTVPSGDKDIFQYDSLLFEYQIETVANTLPNGFITDNQLQFIVGRIINNGDSYAFEDKRVDFWKSKLEGDLSIKDFNFVNPLWGIEFVKNTTIRAAGDRKEVGFGWGFRSSNYTIDPSNYKLTINGGSGGIYHNTSQFVNGDFNGWRVYGQNSNVYSKVISSTKTGSQINLILDKGNKDIFQFATTVFNNIPITIVPDAEEITVQFSKNNYDAVISSGVVDNYEDQMNNYTYEKTFDIKRGFNSIWINVDEYLKVWRVQCKLKSGNEYSNHQDIKADATGYIAEGSFNTFTGEYNNGLITRVSINNGTYYPKLELTSQKITFFNGNRYGIESFDIGYLNSFSLELVVGGNPNYIIINGSAVLSSDKIILVSLYGNQPYQNGNSFTIDWKATELSHVHKVTITDGFNIILVLQPYDLIRSNFIVNCYVDDFGDWKAILIHKELNSFGNIGVDSNWHSGLGITYTPPYLSYDEQEFLLRATVEKVYFKGVVRKGSGVPVFGEMIIQLESAFCPSVKQTILVFTSTNTGTYPMLIDIYPNGEVKVALNDMVLGASDTLIVFGTGQYFKI